jgi:hypothetical protein
LAENMSAMRLELGLEAAEPAALASAIVAGPPFNARPPMRLSIGNERHQAGADWAGSLGRARSLFAAWDKGSNLALSLDRYRQSTEAVGGMVKVWLPDVPRDPRAVLELIAAWPWEVASMPPLHDDWESRPDYEPIGFADLHFHHGWACGFRGMGHDRLVSRRWLDQGLWQLHQGPNDTSLVQFHDLHADSQRAFEQAMPAHQRMGISDTGGFIQSDYISEHEIKGLYTAEDRRMRIVVHGRDVPQREMLDACALRRSGGEDPERPIEQVAYIFIEPERAEAHLHELWLRELECWTFAAGKEVRIDSSYSVGSR